MEELIKKLDGKIEAYSEVSKYKPEDQWMKGYIYGLMEAKQEIESYKNR